MTFPPEQYRLGDLMPQAVGPAPGAAPNVEDIVWRQIQTMQAANWQLHQRWPGGADFVSRTPPAISTGVHLILTLFTCGLWLLVWIPMELFGTGNEKWCRLTVDEQGTPQYSEIGRPKPA
jgi:hypothetical protein